MSAAVKQLPEANWVLISVPGRYAVGVAREALDLGKHVFLYSDNCAVVSSDHDIVHAARAHGAFVMGALEFASKLRASSLPSGSMPHKELDPGENYPARRGPEKKGNPRKLPKSQRQRDRHLKRF